MQIRLLPKEKGIGREKKGMVEAGE